MHTYMYTCVYFLYIYIYIYIYMRKHIECPSKIDRTSVELLSNSYRRSVGNPTIRSQLRRHRRELRDTIKDRDSASFCVLLRPMSCDGNGSSSGTLDRYIEILSNIYRTSSWLPTDGPPGPPVHTWTIEV